MERSIKVTFTLLIFVGQNLKTGEEVAIKLVSIKINLRFINIGL